jgi:hypothetical protein
VIKRIGRSWPILLLAACAVVIAVLAMVVGGPDAPPSEETVERRLMRVSDRAGFPLHRVQCVRDKVFPRSFTCLVEGPFDMHLAWRVRWRGADDLEIRRPDGTRIRF